MALNSSGPISLAGTTAGQSIEIENGGNGTTQISLNDTAVRTLAGVPSGAITMPTNFWGKANRAAISYTFSSNTANSAINLSVLSGYISGKSDITITVNAGIYVYSTSTGSYALDITGGTTGDTLVIVNNGYIMGMGGAGGQGVYVGGSSGGPAINLNFGMTSCTINNTNANAYIGGGGGGGGTSNGFAAAGGGGGAGGGQGGGWYAASAFPGSGGGVGASGGNGSGYSFQGGGGGGGRVFPGVGGTGNAGGTAGGGGYASGYATEYGYLSSTGGGGGGWGASGGVGSYNYGATSGTTGGSANNPGGSIYGYENRSGGSGGKAVNLNAKSVTWTNGDTTRVWGAVS